MLGNNATGNQRPKGMRTDAVASRVILFWAALPVLSRSVSDRQHPLPVSVSISKVSYYSAASGRGRKAR